MSLSYFGLEFGSLLDDNNSLLTPLVSASDRYLFPSGDTFACYLNVILNEKVYKYIKTSKYIFTKTMVTSEKNYLYFNQLKSKLRNITETSLWGSFQSFTVRIILPKNLMVNYRHLIGGIVMPYA